MNRPQVLEGATIAKRTGSGKVYITINYHDGAIKEVFATLGRAGSEERALTEAIGRLCSTALQNGIPVEKLQRQLRGISSEKTFGLGPGKVLSVPDAVGQALEEAAQYGERSPEADDQVGTRYRDAEEVA